MKIDLGNRVRLLEKNKNVLHICIYSDTSHDECDIFFSHNQNRIGRKMDLTRLVVLPKYFDKKSQGQCNEWLMQKDLPVGLKLDRMRKMCGE